MSSVSVRHCRTREDESQNRITSRNLASKPTIPKSYSNFGGNRLVLDEYNGITQGPGLTLFSNMMGDDFQLKIVTNISPAWLHYLSLQALTKLFYCF